MFEINFEQIDVVIFFPKPSTYDESGYEDGFKNSAENLNKIISKFPISKFISISSTRVYNKESDSFCEEVDSIYPTEFRGKLIKEYEEKQIDFYNEKLAGNKKKIDKPDFKKLRAMKSPMDKTVRKS